MSSVKENGFSNSNKVAVKPPKANQERPELGTTSTNGVIGTIQWQVNVGAIIILETSNRIDFGIKPGKGKR